MLPEIYTNLLFSPAPRHFQASLLVNPTSSILPLPTASEVGEG